jgi:hypothetical protein
MSPWGLAEPAAVVPYLQDEDAAVVPRLYDKQVFLMNGNGWIQFGDTFPEYASPSCCPLMAPDEAIGYLYLRSFLHPTSNGHSKIAYHVIDYLVNWGLTVN